MNIELRIPSANGPANERPVQTRSPLNRPSMTQVDRDAFIRELSTEPAVLIRAVVRAFLAAALRGQDALTPAGWRSVIQDLRYMLGSALRDGLESRRPVRPRPLVSVNSATGQDFPVQLVRMLVAAYVATQMSGDEAATPEGRSRILGKTRELVWDGMLDAVKQVPCPSVPRPQESTRAPRRTSPERDR